MSEEARSEVQRVERDINESKHRKAASMIDEARTAIHEGHFSSAEKLANRAEMVAEVETTLHEAKDDLEEIRQGSSFSVGDSGLVENIAYTESDAPLFYREVVSDILLDSSKNDVSRYDHIPTPDELSNTLRRVREIRDEIQEKRDNLRTTQSEINETIDISTNSVHPSVYKLCSDDSDLHEEGIQEFLGLVKEEPSRAVEGVPVLVDQMVDTTRFDQRTVRALRILATENTEELLSTSPEVIEMLVNILHDETNRYDGIRALVAISEVAPEKLEGQVSEIVSSHITDILFDQQKNENQQSLVIKFLALLAEINPERFSDELSEIVSSTLVDIVIDHLHRETQQRHVINLLAAIANTAPGKIDERMSDVVSEIEDDLQSVRYAAKSFPADMIIAEPQIMRSLYQQLSDEEHRQEAIKTFARVSQEASEQLKGELTEFLSDQTTDVIISEINNWDNQEEAIRVLTTIVNEVPDQVDVNQNEIATPQVTTALIDNLRNEGNESNAIGGLAAIAQEAPDQLKAQISELTSPDVSPIIFEKLDSEDSRSEAINVLSIIAEEDPEHLKQEMSAIVGAVQEDPTAIIQIAQDFPIDLVASTDELTEALVELLREESHRPEAIDVLSSVAGAASGQLEDDIAAITAALGDDREEVQLEVCRTLKRIGTEDAIERLRDARREVNDYELRTEIEEMIQEAEKERQQATVDAAELGSSIPQPNSQNRFSPQTDEGDELPAHEVIEPIGSGGNADVKKVRLSENGTIAALKIPRWQGTLSESVVDEFRAEAATWARIDDHDNIIDVLGSGDTPYPWILLDYMPDGSLREHLGNRQFEPAIACDLLVDLCGAIRHAHRHGIVHADLKPENVLFEDEKAKIGDWGLAKVLLEHSTSIEGMTPSYAAPEQLNPDQYGSVDDSTDIYQLGIIAYEMLTGEVPYDRANPAGTVTAILTDTPTPPSEHNPALSEAVDDIISTAIAKEKDDRYESILYFRDDLKNIDF